MTHPEAGPVQAVADALFARFGDAPPTAVVLGSGLGPVVERAQVVAAAPSHELGLPRSGVPGHAGRVVRCQLGGGDLVVLSGRVHLYEGVSAHEVVRGVRALAAWGVQRLLLTCSAGGVREGLAVGDLVLLSDHLSFQSQSPLTGPVPWRGPRFPDMTRAYSPALRAELHDAASRSGQKLGEGVYAAMDGPAYETPAEIRMLRTIGADLVGMSTVPEVLAAVGAGLPVAALALVSNLAAGMTGEALSHDEVTVAAADAAARVGDLLEAWVGR